MSLNNQIIDSRKKEEAKAKKKLRRKRKGRNGKVGERGRRGGRQTEGGIEQERFKLASLTLLSTFCSQWGLAMQDCVAHSQSRCLL